MKQLVLFNFKTYKEASGENAIKLAKILENSQKKYKNYIFIVVPQLVDITNVLRSVRIPIFAQHIDDIDYGRNTGWINPFLLKKLGVKGSIINHSEHRLNFDEIRKRISVCKSAGIKSIVCCKNEAELQKISKLKPNYLAYEPPSLIGGKLSVTSAKPELLKLLSKKYSNLIFGAGINSHEDATTAQNLKVKGILLASNFVKAKNHRKWLKNFLW